MSRRQIMIELVYSKGLADNAARARLAENERKLDPRNVPKMPGCEYDLLQFPPIELPELQTGSAEQADLKHDVWAQPQRSTFIVRAKIDDDKLDRIATAKNVAGVFSDPEIAPFLVCPSTRPSEQTWTWSGSCASRNFTAANLDGRGVWLAIVDIGINAAYLAAHGRPIVVDAARSFSNSGGNPGQYPPRQLARAVLIWRRSPPPGRSSWTFSSSAGKPRSPLSCPMHRRLSPISLRS